MRFYRLLLFVLPLVLFSSQVPAQGLQSKRLNALLARKGWVRLGISESGNRADISLPGGGNVILSGKNIQCAAGTVSVSSATDGLNVSVSGQSPVVVNDVTITPAENTAFGFNGRNYRGRVHITASGSFRVINEIMIDDWLKGVLPAEIGSDAPLEALKAQAVAARSEAIFRLVSPPHKSSGYDFCTGPHCQAYKGISEETPQIRMACDQTLGYVLVAQGDVVNAVYHNVCGGVTAAAEDVWDGAAEPGLVPVFDTMKGGSPDLQTEAAAAAYLNLSGNDSFCYPGNPGYANYAKKYFRWTKTLTASEAGRAAGVGVLTDMRVIERRPSGRVRKLQVTGTAGSKVIEKELPIRNMFDLWSGLFVISDQRNGSQLESITFTGAGNGHGVGLCQHGAREIARRGGRFDQILGHYYPGAKLQKVYRP